MDDLGVRLISHRRPYYGRSDGHSEPSPFATAQDIQVIADRLGIQEFSIVGRSGGGPHALATAAKVSGARSAAVLSSMSPISLDRQEAADSSVGAVNTADIAFSNEELLQSRVSLVREVRRNKAAFLELLEPDLHPDDRAVIGRNREQLLEAYALAAQDDPLGYYYDSLVNLGRIPYGFELSAVDVPTLVWHGRNDPFTSVLHWDYLTRNLPHAEAVLEAGASHFRAFEMLPKAIGWCLLNRSDKLL